MNTQKIWLVGVAEIKYEGDRIKDVKKFIQTLESAFHLDTTAVQVNLSLAGEDDLAAIVLKSISHIIPGTCDVSEVFRIAGDDAKQREGAHIEVSDGDHH